MDDFAHRLNSLLSNNEKTLSVVRNPDGFLARQDTRQAVNKHTGLNLLPINSLIDLRVRFETIDSLSHDKVCYVVSTQLILLPDLQEKIADMGTFTLAKMFPSYSSTELNAKEITYKAAQNLYRNKLVYNQSPDQTMFNVRNAVNQNDMDVNTLSKSLCEITPEWEQPATIERISQLCLHAIRAQVYERIENSLDKLNLHFQQYVDKSYFNLSTSSPVKSPKMVNRILPHIAFNHGKSDKVALIVVDGMAWWQYLILKEKLKNVNVVSDDRVTMAWIPTITRLSRQAIFRGDLPQQDYKQNPKNEERLWRDFWTSESRGANRFQDYEIGYSYNNYDCDVPNCKRLAIVDISLDEKMHACSDLKDLCDLTDNWASKTVKPICDICEQGYATYMTTDHGNLLSYAWRQLSSKEKTFLYQKESRGSRFLIYDKKQYLDDFMTSNDIPEKELLCKDNWAVWRTTRCFRSQDEITHGGSHFMEVVIPFVRLEQKRS